MVCRLTLGKKGYEAAAEALAAVLPEADALRAELQALLEEDTRVYGRVMAAYRLPRATAEEKAARRAAQQAALREAAAVPLSIAERCARVVALALPAAELGNTWAVTDAGVGALLAAAAARAALLNVEINLAAIADADYVAELQRRMAAATDGLDEACARVQAAARARMGA
jgi:formiminotetrahydrofolate cyclodeaminase